MSQSLLTRRTVFGLPVALAILLIFFFLLPSAFRGARFAIAEKKNDIKDWLPADFPETVELDWFARYFMGESFIIATWDGCTANDQRLALLTAKLRHESEQRQLPETPDHQRARQLADQLQLMLEPASMNNWAGQKEKWFATPSGRHYYITPDGRLYRWEEGSNAVGAAVRAVRRALGRYEPKGQLIVALGEPSTSETVNPFYNDPSLLAASLFQTVETGDQLVSRLANEGGPLWPVDLTDREQRGAVAKSRAVRRLTGTLFAPAVPPDFDWSPAAVHDHLPEHLTAELPDDFDFRVRRAVDRIVEHHGGTLAGLRQATVDDQGEAWDELCRALGIPTPPRQTCVLVTLTQLGKDQLSRAVGRGVVGAPRGRLLILADQSGVAAAPPPSMAPPPFDRRPDTVAMAGPRPVLRLGGPPIDNVSIDEEGTVTLARLVGYSALIGLTLAFLCFRSFNITLMVFIVGVSAATLGLAVTYWTGGHVDAIMMSMPSLVYVLGLSGAIHIVNYYRDEVHKRGLSGAATRAARHGLTPCTLAAVTTSLGLVSLCTSNITPIYSFGLYSAIGVMATLLILFTYLPAALETFAPRFALRASGSSGDQAHRPEASGADAPGMSAQTAGPAAEPPGRGSHVIAEFWVGVGHVVTRHYRIASIACLSLFVVGLFGIPKIKTSVQLLKLFDSDSRIIEDYAYLEHNFGKLVPMELVVRMPAEVIASRRSEVAEAKQGEASEDDPAESGQAMASPSDNPALSRPQVGYPLPLLRRAEAIGMIDTAVRRTLGESGTGVVGRTMSAVTFMPPLPAPSRGYSPVRGRFEAHLNDSLQEMVTTDYLRMEREGPFAGSELWRISLRVGALSDVDYGQFVGDLRATVTPVLDAFRAREAILAACDDARPADAGAGNGRRASNFPRVLLLGSASPGRLEEEDFLRVETEAARDRAVEAAVAQGRQGDLILDDKLYFSTLGELLAGERLQPPLWLDLDADDARITPGDEHWPRLLDRVDVVVVVADQQAIDMDALASQGTPVVDLRRAVLPQSEPLLIDGVPSENNAGPLQVIYTGVVPVVYKAQRTLLTSLIESIVLAFFLILIVMIALLIPGRLPRALWQPRVVGCGIAAGMVAMIPNLFPVVVIFGLMGHSHTLVDIGTMMTASVAMGVAVDDTIHFLTWFRDHIDRGMTRIEAVIETYRRVGPAMTQTTIVGGLGLFVFALSTFTPTQRFGTLMLVLLATALIGDLILLPALLAGPLGRWFRPRPAGGRDDEASPASPALAASSDPQDDDHMRGGEATSPDEQQLVGSAPHKPPPNPLGRHAASGQQSSIAPRGS